MYWLYYMIDEFVSVWALLCQNPFILPDFYNHFVLRAISCFFLQSWRSWFKCWVHVLHMCGLLAWGTLPRTSDTRVQAGTVVWCKVDGRCPDWPPGSVHIQTMPSQLLCSCAFKCAVQAWEKQGRKACFRCLKCVTGFKHIPAFFNATSLTRNHAALNLMVDYFHSCVLKSHPSLAARAKPIARFLCFFVFFLENTHSSLSSSI